MVSQKIALVSGGTSGVGKHAALELAQHQFTVYVIGRNAAKGAQVVEAMKQTSHNSAIFFVQADLSDLAEITRIADRLTAQIDHLDVLINATGAMLAPSLTSAGIDGGLMINYVAHFALTVQLLVLLKQAPQGRILTVAGLPFLLNRAKPIVPDFKPVQPTSTNVAVGQATSARILMTLALAEHLKGSRVTANVYHPGNIPDSGYGSQLGWLSKHLFGLLALLSVKNSSVALQLATNPDFDTTSGQFFDDHARLVKLNARYSKDLADTLWQESIRVTSLEVD